MNVRLPSTISIGAMVRRDCVFDIYLLGSVQVRKWPDDVWCRDVRRWGNGDCLYFFALQSALRLTLEVVITCRKA